MEHYAGIDVSLECSSVCVVDGNGKIVREAKVASEPQALIAWFGSLGFGLERIGLEAGPFVAMAVCSDEGSRPRRGTAGDAARAEGARGDAGQVGSQRCPRHRASDAAGLVPAGALQIDECARDPIAADGAQAGAIEASRRGEQLCAGSCAVLASRLARRPGRSSQGRIEELVAGHPHLQMIAKALLAVRAVLRTEFAAFEKQTRRMVRSGHAGTAADVSPGGRPDRGADLCQRDRRSGPVQIVEAGRSPFRVDSEEASIRRDRLHRPDQQDR